MVKSTFSTDQLAKLAGLPSTHMVSYLCRIGLLVPSMSKLKRRGLARKFSFQDVVLARVIANMLRSGVSVAVLRRALKTLSRKLKLPVTNMRSQHVVIVGQQVYLSESPESITDLTADGQLAFCFMLDLPGMFDETTRELRRTQVA